MEPVSSTVWFWIVFVVSATVVTVHPLPDGLLASLIPLCIAAYIFFDFTSTNPKNIVTSFSSKYVDENKTTTLEDIRTTTKIDRPLHWLQHDDYLNSVVVSLQPLIQHDVQIVKEVVVACNDFVQVFYRGVAETDENALSYNKLQEHRMRIQLLEDIVETVTDTLSGFEYVLKLHDYDRTYDIPRVVSIIAAYMRGKIDLLVAKYKLNNKGRRLGTV